MQIKNTKHNIVLLMADTQYEVASTFMRLQEFYESPKFRGRFIDLESYMDWYASEYDNFTYTTDWSGFNVPGEVVRKFFSVHSKNLLQKELSLYNLLADWIKSKKKFYVIATYEKSFDDGGGSVIDHELAHAMFYMFEEYREAMTEHVMRLPKAYRNAVKEALTGLGYHGDVITDETQAYLATSTTPYLKNEFTNKKVNIPWVNIVDIQCDFVEFKEIFIDDSYELTDE